MEQIVLTYRLTKETVAAITLLYKNMEVNVRSPDGDANFFDIVAGVLQGDTLAPCLFIICRDYELRTSMDSRKVNGFTLAKVRRRRYPARTITDANYADDITLLANTPTQSESLVRSLGRGAGDIGFHVNADKTEFICFKATSPH